MRETTHRMGFYLSGFLNANVLRAKVTASIFTAHLEMNRLYTSLCYIWTLPLCNKLKTSASPEVPKANWLLWSLCLLYSWVSIRICCLKCAWALHRSTVSSVLNSPCVCCYLNHSWVCLQKRLVLASRVFLSLQLFILRQVVQYKDRFGGLL